MAVIVFYLFLSVPCVGLQCVIVEFPGHTHLPFVIYFFFIDKVFFLLHANKTGANQHAHLYSFIVLNMFVIDSKVSMVKNNTITHCR